MQAITYGFGTTLEGVSFEEAMERVIRALEAEGFGVLTEIDVKATLKKKLDADHRRYTILGACNPRLAHRALGAEAHIGLLLPCNVVVQEREAQGSIDVSFADPRAMFELVESPALEAVAAEAERMLRAALDALAG